jgi:hypothetical protein
LRRVKVKRTRDGKRMDRRYGRRTIYRRMTIYKRRFRDRRRIMDGRMASYWYGIFFL